jgi:2-polyprenyl-3-methyl-5-hydroxy-6-metoxy-1,4-benzoquinol methylase
VTGILTPPRRRGVEILDDPLVDPEVIRRSMLDVERANALFGGKRAALEELKIVLSPRSGRVSLLDVGTGRGDIPRAAVEMVRSFGITLETIGLDMSEPLLRLSSGSSTVPVRANALHLPFRDSSVDIVLASQVLHHFTSENAGTFIRELDRVARKAVVLSDLRRNRLAAAGLWLGSFPLGFHPVSRHDGVVSVMRGFIPAEMEAVVEASIGLRPEVRRRIGFRLTTHWRKQTRT